MIKISKIMALICCMALLACISVYNPQPVIAAAPGVVSYYQTVSENTFGQWVMKENGWDRYLMFFACNSSVKNGKPSSQTPGDTGTQNPVTGGWWADRIWVTWHYGDGKTQSGWDTDAQAPILLLGPGGAGQGCLIGDPSVVYWQNKWHMYYEGTDDPNGLGNRIFHATADNWSGPWTKQGMVNGLWADTRNLGLSWPTVLVDNGQLILYFTDNCSRLMGAVNTDTTGDNFIMANYDGSKPLNYDPAQGVVNPYPVLNDVNRGTVKYFNGSYQLVHDNYGRTKVYTRTSSNKFDFLSAPATQIMSTSDGAWYDIHVGLPTFCAGSASNRIYFTGTQTVSGWPNGVGKIGYYE